MVLLHGWPDTHLLWDEVATKLADRFHVVTYDQRGHGESTSPQSWRDFSFAELCTDLLAVINDTSPDSPVHLVGHDFGAMYAWDAICDSRFDGRVASFSCVAGTNLDLWGTFARETIRRPTPRRLVGLSSQLVCSSYIFSLFVPGFPRVAFNTLGKPKVWTRVLRTISAVSPGEAVLAPSLVSDMNSGVRIYRANLSKLFRPRRRHTAVPVQMVTAKYDVAIRRIPLSDAPQWADTVNFREVAGGHWLPMTHSEEIAKLAVDFAIVHSSPN
ncbi:alpha/beta fold hydrolase [Gordonia effusa]|nr:alpha/beta fold hydrolase [Gordonia effusa]